MVTTGDQVIHKTNSNMNQTQRMTKKKRNISKINR